MNLARPSSRSRRCARSRRSMYFDLTERAVETPALYSTTRGIPPLNPERERPIHSRTLAPCIRLSLRQRYERPERALRKGTVLQSSGPGRGLGNVRATDSPSLGGGIMQHIMPSRVFNTHAAVKRLQDAGTDDRRAEAVVATLGAAVSEHVATKTDIPTLTADLSWRPSSTRQSSRSRRWSTGGRRTISSGRCAVGSSDSSAPAGSSPRPWNPSPPTSWPSPRDEPTDDRCGDLRHHLG